MKTTSTMLLRSTLAATLLAASQAALAGNAFFGAGIGSSSYDYSSGQCTKDAATAGLTASCDSDQGDLGFKIYGGYNLNQYLGAELAYSGLGQATLTAGTASGFIKANGFSAQIVGTLPLDDALSVFVAGGVYSLKTKLTVSDTSNSVSLADNDSASGSTFGLGLRYAFSKAVAARFEYQRFSSVDFPTPTDEGNIDLISAGLVFNFQ